MKANRIDDRIIRAALSEAKRTMFKPSDAQVVTKAQAKLASRGILRHVVQRVYDLHFEPSDSV